MNYSILSSIKATLSNLPATEPSDKVSELYLKHLLSLIEDLPFHTVESLEQEINFLRHHINTELKGKYGIRHSWLIQGPEFPFKSYVLESALKPPKTILEPNSIKSRKHLAQQVFAQEKEILFKDLSRYNQGGTNEGTHILLVVVSLIALENSLRPFVPQSDKQNESQEEDFVESSDLRKNHHRMVIQKIRESLYHFQGISKNGYSLLDGDQFEELIQDISILVSEEELPEKITRITDLDLSTAFILHSLKRAFKIAYPKKGLSELWIGYLRKKFDCFDDQTDNTMYTKSSSAPSGFLQDVEDLRKSIR